MRSRLTTAIFAAAIVAAACGAPSTARSPAAVAHTTRDEGGCAGCHESVAREWRGSNHAEAFRQPTFQVAYAIEPLPFCAACHAPRADAEAPRPPATDLGVSCLSCHRFDGTRAADTCAGCHEFPFPGTARLLQKTVSEHARARTRASCIQCHAAPRDDGGARHTDHRFAASRDELEVRAAATIEARREGDELVIVFRRAAVGHALPTGDVFRRLRIVATAGAGTRTRILGRDAKRADEIDERPFVDGRDEATVRLPIGDLRPPIKWKVVYERVAHPTSADGTEAAIDGAIELAHGSLPPN